MSSGGDGGMNVTRTERPLELSVGTADPVGYAARSLCRVVSDDALSS